VFVEFGGELVYDTKNKSVTVTKNKGMGANSGVYREPETRRF